VRQRIEAILRVIVLIPLGLGFIFLGIEPLIIPPWGRLIHSWWLFPIPIPYLGNIFWCIVGLALIAYGTSGGSE